MKRRKSAPKKKPMGLPQPHDDLGATSHALYEGDDAGGPPPEPESVEDPLDDWPESAGEADPWVTSRRVRRDQEREG